MRDHGEPYGGPLTIQFRSALAVCSLLHLLLLVSAPLLAQGTATAASYTRGRPLTEWVAQTSHYIPEMRREAVKAIGGLGAGARSALPALIRATRDENLEVRYWAVDAIRRIGPGASEAAPALTIVMADDDRSVQEMARRALAMMGPAAVPSLLPALRSPDPWVRASAAEVLGGVAGNRGDAVKALTQLLADDSLWVRSSAAWGLGRIGKPAAKAVKPLTAALAEEIRTDPAFAQPAQRARVENLVYALGRTGDAAKDAVPLIVSVLYDGSDSLRHTASTALAGIGKRTAQPLGTALRSGPAPVRLEAARGLRLLGPQGKDAVKDLIKTLETTDELEGGRALVVASADALGAIGKSAKNALPVLERQRKRSVSPDVVASLDRAIRKIRIGG